MNVPKKTTKGGRSPKFVGTLYMRIPTREEVAKRTQPTKGSCPKCRKKFHGPNVADVRKQLLAHWEETQHQKATPRPVNTPLRQALEDTGLIEAPLPPVPELDDE